jgi:hypothetical protein
MVCVWWIYVRSNEKGNGLFNWEEIKYDFISFIELLQI